MATCRQRNCTFMQICFQTPEKKSDVIREISVKRNMRHDFIDSFRQIDRFLISRKVKTSRPRRLSRCFPCFSKKEKKKKEEKLAESIKIITFMRGNKYSRIVRFCSNRLESTRNHCIVVLDGATPLLFRCKNKTSSFEF